MACCNLWHVFSPTVKRESSQHIVFHAKTADYVDAQRAAVLSSDRKARHNLISQELTRTLDIPIQSLDDLDEGSIKLETSWKQKHGVDGYVDLGWCFRQEKTINKSRFFVASMQEPPYDAVLGRTDAIRYGLLKSKHR